MNLSIDIMKLGAEDKKHLKVFLNAILSPEDDEVRQECGLAKTEDAAEFYNLEKPLPAEKKVSKPKSKKTTESVVDEYEAAKGVEVVEAEEVKTESPAEEESTEKLVLADLQALVTSDLLDSHRAALKNKIAELAGKTPSKLADLPVSAYPEMKRYILSLG